MKKLLLVTALVVCSAARVLAADNPWVGTWKLNIEKSNFTGDTFTYSKSENGLYHFSDGSTSNFDFGIDGKEYPALYGNVVTWTAAGDNAWDSVWKLNGTLLENVHRTLSADGNTLTVTESGTKPDGSTFNNVTVYERVTGTAGLLGKWKSTKVNISSPDTVIVSSPADGSIRWEIPEYKESLEGKTDGSDLPVTGPTVPAGLTVSIKILSATELTYTVKISGKPVSLADQTLSADGKTIREVVWSPGKESEKSTAVYEKQ